MFEYPRAHICALEWGDILTIIATATSKTFYKGYLCCLYPTRLNSVDHSLLISERAADTFPSSLTLQQSRNLTTIAANSQQAPADGIQAGRAELTPPSPPTIPSLAAINPSFLNHTSRQLLNLPDSVALPPLGTNKSPQFIHPMCGVHTRRLCLERKSNLSTRQDTSSRQPLPLP
jgi:hypothetical protein